MAEVEAGQSRDNDRGSPTSKIYSKKKSTIELSAHRRFENVASYVSELGGDKGWVIEKVLIANNGVAAVKAIRSIRRWAYEVFGDEHTISFVVMATPEDLRANAEYIRMGDVIVDVPGGSNNHNYANVTLIVELARLHGVHAVWAGWGHASENPLLPDTLAQSSPPIKFIGPAGPPMRALGDKIGSTIIAQSAGVPCIAWNGDDVKAEYDRSTGSLPAGAYEKANITTAKDAVKAAERIGFPIMIKASEGGGGKGIRRVDKVEDVLTCYRQVCGEVPGSPIFIMKLSSNSRHLEVQLLADEYGNAVALNGRDCSVQRRHQKIIEEGPPVAASQEVWTQMEKAAVSLAKAVGYTNAGTVEYLYSEEQAKFYFLELNPRLQVEHPVTEMITRVNLPAAQLQVAMGIPLYNIPEIRELYGKNRFEMADPTPSSPKAVIDFDSAQRVPPNGHCIAVRITAENAEAGFKPTSGGIQELNFRSTPSVWGYFSMDSSGSIHEFADSQFGHLFANGTDREQARRNMVLALKELSIRGDISTTVDYISKLIELDDYVENKIDTGWLDALIKKNVDGIGAFDAASRSGAKVSKLNDHTDVVIGATIQAFDLCTDGEKQFLALLEKGQLPPKSLLSMVHNLELILNGVKFRLTCTRRGPNVFAISLTDEPTACVSTNVRNLSDGGYLIDIGGKSHVAYLTSKGDVASGMRLNIAGATAAFSADYDPTCLRTDVAGKLVKRLVQDGDHVKKGDPYAEIEVMKMFMPLKVEEAGVVSWNMNEGAALAPGDLLASLELDNPENVTPVEVFVGDLDVIGWGKSFAALTAQRPHLLLRSAIDQIKGGMAGYVLDDAALEIAMQGVEKAVTDPLLPVFEIDEQLSVLSGRIPSGLFEEISCMLKDFRSMCQSSAGSGVHLRFSSEKVLQLISETRETLDSSSELTAFDDLIRPLKEAALPYTKSRASGIPGAERAMQSFLDILRGWILVERCFSDGKSYADAVDGLRRAHKDSPSAILDICRSHSSLKATAGIVEKIVSLISDASRIDPQTSEASPIGKRASIVTGAGSLAAAMPSLSEIATIKGNDSYSVVALKARKLLLQESMPSVEQRKRKFWDASLKLSEASAVVPIAEVESLLNEHLPMEDILYPLLEMASSSKEEVSLLELLTLVLYRSYTLKDFDKDANSRCVKFSFLNKASEHAIRRTSINSISDLSKIVSTSSLTEAIDSDSDGNLLKTENKEKISPSTLRTGVFALVESVDEFSNPDTFTSTMKKFSTSSQSPVNVLYVVVKAGISGESETGVFAEKCENIVDSLATKLEANGVRRISFLFHQKSEGEIRGYTSPAVFTFRCPSYREETLYRNIFPSQVYHLDLNRIAGNFRVRNLGSRHTSTCLVHMYEASPKTTALAKDKKANKNPRVFARALSFVLDFSSSSFERLLVDALNAMDVVNLKSKADNHLFVNLVGESENLVLDPVVVEQVTVDILKRHSKRIAGLGISEVEARVVCCLARDSPPIALRLVASNPTGYVHVMSTYVEAADDAGCELVFKLIGGTKASLASSSDSSWEGRSVNSPYPLTRAFDAQRQAALRASDTLYCYDLPALFEAAIEQQWTEASNNSGVVEHGLRAAGRPLMVMYTSELVVQKKASASSQGNWTMADYLNGDLEMVQVNRGAGGNDVGMVAWLMVLKTVEFPDGRQVVLVANDITHKAGSFGTREDVVFKMASEFAREHRIPRLYVASNSGARIGLAEGVRKAYKVAFKESNKPENGFDFLYLTEEDYASLVECKQQVQAEKTTYNGETVYRLTDVIGDEPDLGVENLKGSGLIAGETSAAYDEIFTLTIVLGRTVGIGAYLVRLGQRTIQKTTASPIILTGFQALNKLMGVDVYSTNDQLGGPGIMYPNGVSHMTAKDHLKAVKQAVDWLSYVPANRGGLLPISNIQGIEDIERPIGFTPSPGVPYDPKMLLAGGEDDSGNWVSGFFDKGSFTESLAGWAKTVIVGRARLGGIPMGVVITENRTAEAIKPADPADLSASEAIIQQAGCVWFPNSAYKTAQAINDFRTEDLPLIVFANWRGFSGGQRDMFDEVLKYGSLIVDAFVAYKQPVFVFIPPYGEIRGGAWVVLDSSINSNVMEMYASAGSARGGVLEANGAAEVKYRTKDLLLTMHRLDEALIGLDKELADASDSAAKVQLTEKITSRERALLPVYEQIAVQFCELHDTPVRMQAVGVIERQVEWKHARSFFYWRLRRKLAEFDLRRKIVEGTEVGRNIEALTGVEASAKIKKWFVSSSGLGEEMWSDDKAVLQWMATNNDFLEQSVVAFTKECVVQEVFKVMTAGGQTAVVGAAGIVEGIVKACNALPEDRRAEIKKSLFEALQKDV